MDHSLKATLIHLIEQALREEKALVAELTSAERCAEGTPEDWSAKDTVAHVGEWKARLGRSLDADEPDRQSAPGEIDAVNAGIFEQNRDLTWSDVLGLLCRGSADLVERVQMLSEASLICDHPPGGPTSEPIWRRIVGGACIHPLTHISQLRISRGQSHLAVCLIETMVESLAPLGDSPCWRGELLYDLACTCALAGESGRAVDLLAEALRLQPELIDWSRSDPDFAAIRLEPAYQALYCTEGA